MTTLPTGAQLVAAANVSVMQGLVSNQATAISEMPGGAVATTLTIAAGAVTPTVACHLVDTESAAASDDLTNIVTTNHTDGRRLLISMVDAARIVTIKHNAGGAGQVALANSYDLVLTVGGWVELKRTGANWEEVGRSQNLIRTVQLSGPVNESYATVASHATTADIWGARGNVINFTGTATVTAFPAAPQAGVRRRLICAGACSFTSAAGFVVDGGSYTAAAGDVVDVEAVSMSSFKLHPIPVGGVGDMRGANNLAVGAGGVANAATARTNLSVPGLADVNTYTKVQRNTPVALSVSANAVAVDLSLSNFYSLTLQATTGQTLSNPSNGVAGQSGVIAITQNATPSTLAYGSQWIEATGGTAPAVSTTASAQNLLSYYVFDSTHIYYTLNKHGVT